MAGVALLGAALSGCIGYDGDFDRGYQIDEQSLDKVKIGVDDEAGSARAARHALDHVHDRRRRLVLHRPEDARALAFMPAKITDQNVLAIYFDKSGKVSRIANYGMKDGKVFDFVSQHDADRGPRTRLPEKHLRRPAEVQLEFGRLRRAPTGGDAGVRFLFSGQPMLISAPTNRIQIPHDR